MTQYQSSTIPFTVTLPADASTYDAVIVEFYTDKSSRVKFIYPFTDEYEAKVYNEAVIGNSTDELKCRLLSKHTAKMLGKLMFEVKLITDINEIDAETVNTGAIDTTIEIISLAAKNDN
jgi:hypothetical protein